MPFQGPMTEEMFKQSLSNRPPLGKEKQLAAQIRKKRYEQSPAVHINWDGLRLDFQNTQGYNTIYDMPFQGPMTEEMFKQSLSNRPPLGKEKQLAAQKRKKRYEQRNTIPVFYTSPNERLEVRKAPTVKQPLLPLPVNPPHCIPERRENGINRIAPTLSGPDRLMGNMPQLKHMDSSDASVSNTTPFYERNILPINLNNTFIPEMNPQFISERGQARISPTVKQPHFERNGLPINLNNTFIPERNPPFIHEMNPPFIPEMNPSSFIPEMNPPFIPERNPPFIPERNPPFIPERNPPFISERNPPFIPERNPPFIPERNPPFISERNPPFIPESNPPFISERNPPFIPERNPPFISERNPPFIPERNPPFISERNPPFIPERNPPFISERNPPFIPDRNPPFIPERNPPFIPERNPPFIPEMNPPFIPEMNPPFIPERNPPFIPEMNPPFIPERNPPFIPEWDQARMPPTVNPPHQLNHHMYSSNAYDSNTPVVYERNVLPTNQNNTFISETNPPFIPERDNPHFSDRSTPRISGRTTPILETSTQPISKRNSAEFILERMTAMYMNTQTNGAIHYPIVIAPVDYPTTTFTSNQLFLIEKFILSQFNFIPEGANLPKFFEAQPIGDYFYVNCADKFTCDWIARRMTGAPWQGAKMIVLPEKSMCPIIRTVVSIPGPVMPVDTLFDRIEYQNQRINTATWKVVHIADKGCASHILCITMDELSWQKLERRGCRLFLNYIIKVQFILFEKKNWSDYKMDEIQGQNGNWYANAVEYLKLSNPWQLRQEIRRDATQQILEEDINKEIAPEEMWKKFKDVVASNIVDKLSAVPSGPEEEQPVQSVVLLEDMENKISREWDELRANATKELMKPNNVITESQALLQDNESTEEISNENSIILKLKRKSEDLKRLKAKQLLADRIHCSQEITETNNSGPEKEEPVQSVVLLEDTDNQISRQWDELSANATKELMNPNNVIPETQALLLDSKSTAEISHNNSLISKLKIICEDLKRESAKQLLDQTSCSQEAMETNNLDEAEIPNMAQDKYNEINGIIILD